MGPFYVKLHLAKSLDECQHLFDDEVERLEQLSMYKGEPELLHRRILVVAGDVQKHMKQHGIEGMLLVPSIDRYTEINHLRLIKKWIKLPIILLVAFGLIFATTNYVSSLYRVNTVSGRSMSPTLLEDDYILIDKKASIERFDVVVATDIHSSTQYDVVKRVIGLPGDEIRFENDKLYINGDEYVEEYISDYLTKWQNDRLQATYAFDAEAQTKAQNAEAFTVDAQGSASFSVTVDEGTYFLLGDNRLLSRDSRIVGNYSFDTVVGEVIWKGRF